MSSLSKSCLANLFCNALFSLVGLIGNRKIILGHSFLVLLSCTLWITLLECCHIEMLSTLSKTNTSGTGTKGAFHSTQNSRNFVWYSKWNRPFRFGPMGIFGNEYCCPFRSVRPKCLFPFDKILSPLLLFPSLLTRTMTKRAVAWVGSVQPECTVPLGH